jgi:HPt (histidine-containing phosphotransfer) domain-containing protein
MRDICGDTGRTASLSSLTSMLATTSAPVHQPPAIAHVLDQACLQRLHELDPQGTNRVVERVLRAFEASLQRLLPQAVQALGRDDHEAVRHVVHTLKSSSASVGALELSRCCSEIENRLRAHQVDGLTPLLSRLDAEGGRVLAAVRDLLAP